MDNPIKEQEPTTPPSASNAEPAPQSYTINEGVPDAPDDDDTTSGGLRGALSTIAILIIAPLIALSLTAFVFQSYEVDGPSMETTLQNHDRLIVYKLPRTLARITGNTYTPNRGDIVIFTRKEGLEFGSQTSKQLIKRVIAFPGERVVVKDGVLTVFNQVHPEGFKPDDAPYGKVIITTPGDIDLVVPEKYLYVCGDNRTNSLDSRSFGPIEQKDLVGKLAIRVYPFGKSKTF